MKIVVATATELEDGQSLRWSSHGFWAHSWPCLVFESLHPDEASRFKEWIDDYRNSLPKPMIGQKCILTLVVREVKSIMIICGDGNYHGETDTVYQLDGPHGIQDYSKNDQLLFGSTDEFNAFRGDLELKFGGEGGVPVEFKKDVLRESSLTKATTTTTRIKFLAGVK